MDLFARQRLAAHTHTAVAHERSADFHAEVSEYFRSRGVDVHATRAHRLAEDHRALAMQERIYAFEAGGAPYPAMVRGQLRLTAYSERRTNYLPPG